MSTNTHSPQLTAVVALLDDPNPAVARPAAEELERLLRSDPAAVRRAIEDAPARARVIGRKLIARWRAGSLESELAVLAVGRFDVESLEDACILLARWRDPEVSPAAIRAQLDQLADGLAKQLPTECSRRELWSVLRRWLFIEQGFDGNQAAYDSPDNSFIDRVLETRLGIPITLSALVLCLGQRLGLDLVGVGMPCHFLVKFRSDPGVLLDPFNGGRPLTRDDCEEFLRGFGHPFDDRYLEETPPRRIFGRMLVNLIASYQKRGDLDRARQLVGWLRHLDLD